MKYMLFWNIKKGGHIYLPTSVPKEMSVFQSKNTRILTLQQVSAKQGLKTILTNKCGVF